MSSVSYTPSNVTHPLKTGPANACCDGPCSSNGTPIKCYSMYSTSQSFFLQMKKNKRTASGCSNYSSNCAQGGCTNPCSKNGKPRITTYRKTGTSASPFKGGMTSAALLSRTRRRQHTTVRGQQSSQSTLIRASRSVQTVPISTVGRPNTYGTGIMVHRVPRTTNNWNAPKSKECCADTSTVNLELGYTHPLN